MQQQLFNNEKIIPENENKSLWDQFARLGEMMGDGLHHESDGKWISRDYKKLSKILIPEIKEVEKKRRKRKAEKVQEQMQKLLSDNKCKCGGILIQKRKGTKVCYCSECDQRYKAK